MRQFINITKALADSTRVRVLLALRKQKLCACQITELFGLAQSTMSKHFYLLRQAGLVDSRKDGRWVYYALPGKEASPVIKEALEWVQRSLAEDQHAAEDARNLEKILKLDPTDVCRKQCGR
ncbi:MAG: metalloregulator ArsR/SmtB family transcription factor [Candidatus Omnitrophica bacterium]|nr:metalloregulator ArsR/SmtB family transcription factor [Candidatus Omnitrophota bacterium]